MNSESSSTEFRDSIRPIGRETRHADYIEQDFYDDEKENDDGNRQSQIVVQMSEDRWELENGLEVANSMRKIEQESHTINQIFSNLHEIVQVSCRIFQRFFSIRTFYRNRLLRLPLQSQQGKVDSIENSVEEAHSQVVAAEKELVQVAAKAKGAMYPLVGAIIGTCIGGPVGFIGGLKIGAVVAFSGSILGTLNFYLLIIRPSNELLIIVFVS